MRRSSRAAAPRYSAGELVRARYEGREFSAKVLHQIDLGHYQVRFLDSAEGEWDRPVRTESIIQKDLSGDHSDLRSAEEREEQEDEKIPEGIVVLRRERRVACVCVREIERERTVR
jgi:hypothetical protein